MDQNMPSGQLPSQPSGSGGGKKAMWIIIIVIVLALLAGYYFTHRSSGPGTTLSLKAGSSGSGQGQMINGQATLKALMASPVPEKCNFQSTEGTTTTQGTIYVSGGKMRGDMDDGTRQSHMLSDGQNYYLWESDQPNGYKVSVQEINNLSSNAQQSNTQEQAADPNTSYNYSCDNWTTDSSEFTPPGDITFQDVSAMMQNMPNMPTGAPSGNVGASGSAGASSAASMKAQECAACDSAGAQKAQCLAALGCSQ